MPFVTEIEASKTVDVGHNSWRVNMNKRKYMKQSCHHPRHSVGAGIKVIRNYKRSLVSGDGWGWRQQCVTKSSLKLCAYVIKYSGSIKIRAIRLEIQLKVFFFSMFESRPPSMGIGSWWEKCAVACWVDWTIVLKAWFFHKSSNDQVINLEIQVLGLSFFKNFWGCVY